LGSDPGRRLLLVEDDYAVAMGVRYALEQEGWDVTVASTVAEAREAFDSIDFALTVVDIGLPDGSGLDLCREWRRRSPLPILFLTARDLELDRVLGLELGGDDYVTKPFSTRELVARVRALYRRSYELSRTTSLGETVLEARDLLIDLERHRVTRGGDDLRLTPTEFDLLYRLARRPGKVFTREELLNSLWGTTFEGSLNTIDVHIHNLRRKLREGCEDKSYIDTVRGLGYRWREA